MLELKVKISITDNLKYKGGRLKEKNQRPRRRGRKQPARFVACLLAITIVVGSVPGKSHAKPIHLLESRESIRN